MSGSSGIGQLLKGVIVGIVLILAIVGTMSMLDKNKDGDTPIIAQTPVTTTATDTTSPEIKAPEISIASQTPTDATTSEPVESKPDSTSDPEQKPVLEGEKTAEELAAEQKAAEEAAKPKFGILKLRTINPNSKESLMADYVVINSKNTKVAESNNSGTASYRLPVGTYKVITTLSSSTNNTTRNREPVQSTQTINISENKISDEVFELEPPTTIGVLQVSATNASSNKSMKANFIVQDEKGEAVASRNNVTHTLFKLKAGSYKVTVKSGNNSDFRTIVVEPGESTSEVFKLRESFLQGKVLVKVLETNSNKPVTADIEITTVNGKKVQELKSVSQTEIALPAGQYTIKATSPNGQLNKNISVTAGQDINQIFRFDAPETKVADEIKISNDVKITGVKPDETPSIPTSEVTKTTEANTAATQPETTETNSDLGFLKLFARNNDTQKPIKSNFYVQALNGRNIDKKIYVDSAQFNLKPGTYRITVRSNGHKNIVRNIKVSANKTINEAFLLHSTLAPVATVDNNKKTDLPVRSTAPPKPAKTPTVIPNGFLNVAMRPAKNTHFIIANRKGKKIVELTSVPSGNFKLDTGVYTVTAIHNGQRRKQTIQVLQGKTAQLNFNLADFQAQTKKVVNNNAIQKGVLRSRIVDNAGRPLRGNLTVTNLRGQVVARSNSVTVGVFDLPAVPHTIMVNFQGLTGSERVTITAGKTTVQTFTISPNNSRPAPVNRAPVNQPRDPKDVLRDKLKEELRRIF